MRSFRRLISARRLRGDMDLGLDHVRVDGQGAKRWAEIDTPGGLLPGGSYQGVMAVSDDQNYRIGTRRLIDERVYRYTQADADRQLRPAYGVFPQVTYPESAVVAATSLAGTYVITCTAQGATVILNEFAEGYLSILSGGAFAAYGQGHKIKSNTAATIGNTFTVTLYDPLVLVLTDTVDTVTLYRSPYGRVVSMRQRQIDGVATDWRKVSFNGVPNRYVAVDEWCWIQTWGPCPVVGSSGTEGVADSERCMQFADDGCVLRLRDLGDGLGRHQIAGFILPVTSAGAIPSPLLLNLTISP